MLAVANSSSTRQRERLVQHLDDAFGDLDRVSVTSSRSSRTITNSSPPKRATVSAARTSACSRRPRPSSSSSPAAWPRLSFTTLKRSRSRKSTATLQSARSAARQRECEAVDEERPVGKVRQVVVQCLVRERLLGSLAVGDVAHLHEEVVRVPVGIGDERHVDEDRDDGAVVTDHPVLALVELLVAVQEPGDPVPGALALGGVQELERASAEQCVGRLAEHLGERGVHRREGLFEVEDTEAEGGAVRSPAGSAPPPRPARLRPRAGR